MNERIKIVDVYDRLLPLITVPGVRVGHAFEADYAEAFAKSFPGVWVIGSRMLPSQREAGRGYARLHRQTMNAQIAVRLTTRRVPLSGDPTPEESLDALFNQVFDALFGWQPTHAEEPLEFASYGDGPSTLTYVAADLVLKTTSTFQRATT